MSNTVQAGGLTIGHDEPVVVIAEGGVNHDGDVSQALRLVDAAAKARADVVKFQHFSAGRLVTDGAVKAGYQVQTTGDSGGQAEMLGGLELTVADQRQIRDRCRERQVSYLCTPYDDVAADELLELEVHAFKVASADATNRPLLRHLAALGRPVLLSTGMCSLGDVEQALTDLQGHRDSVPVVILHCVSEYPADEKDLNLKAISTLRAAFGVPVGFSDHTLGQQAAAWAVAAGACVVEKHLTLDRGAPGPDHRASLEPDDFTQFVQTIRRTETALGTGRKVPTTTERDNAAVMRRSLTSARSLETGHRLSPDDLLVRRPAGGLDPRRWDEVVGRKTTRRMDAGMVLSEADVDWTSRG